MSHGLPDVQASRPDVTVGLNRVGVTDVEKRLSLSRSGDCPVVLMATFSVYVDLPGWRKGADMSRNMEVIDETIEAAVREPAYRTEDVCGDVAERLLEKHEYTSRAEVSMDADLVLDERTPATERPTQHTVTVKAGATATEKGTTEEIGAEVTGMTVCPCSQGMSASRARETLLELGVEEGVVERFLEEVPQSGHAQRGHATLTVESEGEPEIDLLDVIDIAREAMSARIYNLAKRPDEDYMTHRSHANAKFVEDCVRDMAAGCVARLEVLSDEAVIRMEQSNDESIHQHNAHAERVATLGTLRGELDGDGEPVPAAD
ncbi:GTP cyclohydrolase I FolE2 [Halobacteriales archaeon QS_3_64_16]|nr:MAG: GTP cyclohydrolase I FolE2 [Halobacteriales archaeon QS_3_64_16]